MSAEGKENVEIKIGDVVLSSFSKTLPTIHCKIDLEKKNVKH